MTNDRVSIHVADAIADVTLNRPDKLNALDSDMFSALSEASAALAKRDDVRVVVLSGSGRAFCAGLDLGAMAGSDPDHLIKDHLDRYSVDYAILTGSHVLGVSTHFDPDWGSALAAARRALASSADRANSPLFEHATGNGQSR